MYFLLRLDAKTLAERRIHSADIGGHLSGRMLDRRAIVKHNQVRTTGSWVMKNIDIKEDEFSFECQLLLQEMMMVVVPCKNNCPFKI